MYPTKVKINDTIYPINTDFKIGLRCFEIIEDEDLCGEEKSMAIIYLLFGFIPDNDLDLFVDRAIKFLQCGQTTEEQEEKQDDMDFRQDEKYIVASFMSDYHMDLSKEDIHWYQYINLIGGLTKNSVLSNVRELRAMDLSEIKDSKERNKIAKMQEQVALKRKKTKEEIEAEEQFNNLMKGE